MIIYQEKNSLVDILTKELTLLTIFTITGKMDNFEIEIEIKEKEIRILKDQLEILYLKRPLLCVKQEKSSTPTNKEIKILKEQDKTSELIKKDIDNFSKNVWFETTTEEEEKEKEQKENNQEGKKALCRLQWTNPNNI